MVIICLIDCIIADLSLCWAIRCCPAVGRGQGTRLRRVSIRIGALLVCGQGDPIREEVPGFARSYQEDPQIPVISFQSHKSIVIVYRATVSLGIVVKAARVYL